MRHPSRPILFATSRPPYLLRGIQVVQVVQLRGLAIRGNLIGNERIVRVGIRGKHLSYLILKGEGLYHVREFPILATTMVTPPMIPIVGVRVFFYFTIREYAPF